MSMITRPGHAEAAKYYFTYIDQVEDGDVREILDRQQAEAISFLESIADEHSLHRYADGKWSIREVVNHINDTERVFTLRALWFARGFPDALPSFDQNVAVSAAAADELSWSSHIEEFRAVRAASVALFRNLPENAWSARGIASGYPFTVRALAYLTAGHLAHHLRLLRERYL